jgi:hypothetical protein
MATGILDAGTAYKIMAWGIFQEEGRLKLRLTVSKVLSLTDKYRSTQPIPVVARSKATVCCRSFAGIAGSNSAGGMDVRLL